MLTLEIMSDISRDNTTLGMLLNLMWVAMLDEQLAISTVDE